MILITISSVAPSGWWRGQGLKVSIAPKHHNIAHPQSISPKCFYYKNKKTNKQLLYIESEHAWPVATLALGTDPKLVVMWESTENYGDIVAMLFPAPHGKLTNLGSVYTRVQDQETPRSIVSIG